MLNKSGILLILIFLLTSSFSSAAKYTRSLQVSLLTQDAGDEMYAYFGHTAIRVRDDSLKVDVVFNYGTFDFNTPNFYTRFVKGDLDYCLSIDDYDYFVDFSEETKRTIREQILDLTYEEKLTIVNMLETCYLTDARYYRYDFLKNNCATKIRDIIEDATDKRIDFSKSGYEGESFRQLLKPFISKNYWVDFGINLVMGMETDKAASPSDYMFLPIYIHDFLEGSEFASDSQVILDASPDKKEGINFSYISPWIIVLILLGLSFWTKTRKIILYTVLIIFGLLGLLIVFLGLYSLHPALSNNLNFLWTITGVLILFFRSKKINEYFKLVFIGIIALFIALQGILPQDVSITFIPWMILLISISILDLNIIKNKLFKKQATQF